MESSAGPLLSQMLQQDNKCFCQSTNNCCHKCRTTTVFINPLSKSDTTRTIFSPAIHIQSLLTTSSAVSGQVSPDYSLASTLSSSKVFVLPQLTTSFALSEHMISNNAPATQQITVSAHVQTTQTIVRKSTTNIDAATIEILHFSTSRLLPSRAEQSATQPSNA